MRMPMGGEGTLATEGGPLKPYYPKPKSAPRKLSPNPPPYQHPRILFTAADRPELVDRAKGDNVVGTASFRKLSQTVQDVVYTEGSPVKTIFDVFRKSINDSQPLGDPQKAFEGLCELVKGKVDPSKVLYGEFYTELFNRKLAPVSLALTLQYARLFQPPAMDTTPELGAKYLFACSEEGVPIFFSPIYEALQNSAYVAWIDGDDDKLQDLAGLLCLASRVHLLWYTPGPSEYSNKSCHWGGNETCDGHPDETVSMKLALAYDILFSSATEQQRVPVRRLLLSVGYRRTGNGFDHHQYNGGDPALYPLRCGTFQAVSAYILLVHYAVEGESVEAGEGGEQALSYDSWAAECTAMSIKYWLTHGTAHDPTGPTREAPGYFSTAMRQGSMAAWAAARRGYDIFNSTNFYAALMDVFRTLSPWSLGPRCNGAHDGVGFCGGFGQSEYYLLVKYMYPDDPLADFIYQKYNMDPKKVIRTFGVDRMPFQASLLGLDVTPRNILFADLVKQVPMPLAFFSNLRGMGTARSSYEDENGCLLYFECRPDTYCLGHCHCNRNHFYVEGVGRPWISVGQYHNTEPEAHSSVLIDGVGQGGSRTSAAPPELARLWSLMPGKVVETFHSDRLTLFAGDASVAYRYTTDGPIQPTTTPGRPGLNNKRNPLQIPHTFEEFFHEKPSFGEVLVKDKETGLPKWVDEQWWPGVKICCKAEFNPVEYAFRTACLVRGPNPYVLIVDDIRKDNNPHTYTWVANTTIPYTSMQGTSRPVVMLDGSLYGVDNKTAAVFVRGEDFDEEQRLPVPGCPRFLLRVLDAEGAAEEPIRVVHVEKGFPEKLDRATYAEYWRIEIKRRGVVEPAFKILLFPFIDGQSLPSTSWNEQKTELSVVWQDSLGSLAQHDVLGFGKNGNRTIVSIVH